MRILVDWKRRKFSIRTQGMLRGCFRAIGVDCAHYAPFVSPVIPTTANPQSEA